MRPSFSALVVFAFVGLACDSRAPNQGSKRPGDAAAVAAVAATATATNPDPDGDGKSGADDRCPEEPGIEPDGCPLRDEDGDGILDPEDRCPDACEVINGVDDDGCPDPNPGEHPEIEALLGPIVGLAFQVDKDRIKPVSFPVLDRISEVLVRHPQVKISTDGHNDIRLQERYSRSGISRRRADSVRDYLVMRGVDTARLTTHGFGVDMPIDTNRTAKGRARNRRVALTLVGPEPTVAPGCKL